MNEPIRPMIMPIIWFWISRDSTSCSSRMVIVVSHVAAKYSPILSIGGAPANPFTTPNPMITAAWAATNSVI